MESLEDKIDKFLAVEEAEADWIRPYTGFTGRGNCSGSGGGDGLEDGRGWGGAAVTPGDGTPTGEGGNMGRDVAAANLVYDGCGMPDGNGFGYAEDLDEARCYHAHLPFGRIKRFGGRTVRYTPLMPVEIDYSSYDYFTCDVFSDRASMKDCDISRVPVIIDSLEDDVAKGCVLLDDLTLKPCFIARVGDSFALGEDPGSALDLAASRHKAAVSPEPEPECSGDDELPF